MLFTATQSLLYRYIARPILFRFDPEFDHNLMTWVGEALENQKWLVRGFFSYTNPLLNKEVLGIKFQNPVGLAAGFDYDGHLAKVMHSIGFGFNTVGTVTALPYQGNPRPRLARLPKSKSLLVNKGFKSSGVYSIRSRLDEKQLSDSTIGISVGSSNLPVIDSVDKAIADYLTTLTLFSDRKYVKYFELNISCPNVTLKGAFTQKANFLKLCKEISKLKLSQPIFVKMPNEISFSDCDTLISIGLKYDIRGYIFSNLVKNRSNPAFNSEEIHQFSHLAGNFSGKPTVDNSNKLISHAREKYGNTIAIIGCGGIFSASDARSKFEHGADLVQLITGMIYEGPQLIGQINRALATRKL